MQYKQFDGTISLTPEQWGLLLDCVVDSYEHQLYLNKTVPGSKIWSDDRLERTRTLFKEVVRQIRSGDESLVASDYESLMGNAEDYVKNKIEMLRN